MSQYFDFSGAGKGGKTPKEAPDSLFSNNIAHIVDLLSEGEIEGLVGTTEAEQKTSIFYNEVAILGPSGEVNHSGVIIRANYGTPDQPPMPGFDDVRTSVPVTQDLPFNVYKTISFPNDGDVTAVAVTIAASQFFEVDKDGDTNGTYVTFVIERSQNGGTFEPVFNGTIRGKQTDEYTVDYRVPITDPSGNTAIRVKRTRPDSTSLKVNNNIQFKTYTRIVEQKLNYPNCAMVGHVIDAKQFGNKIPTRQYRVRGIKCRIPHNYNPVTRAYTGPFNGTFTTTKHYTNNPLYIFLELVTNKRFGLGRFFSESLLDLPSLYQSGKWCDDLVPNGKGGTEPRWTCNNVINNRGEAFNVLKELVSCFRGSLFWMQAKLWAVGDATRTPVKIVTNANVIKGKFTYTGESNRQRHSVINVTYNDPDLFFRRGIETVVDPKLIREFGYKPKDYGAFGCTSRGQAQRLGRAILFSQEFESDMVSYKAAFDHMAVGDGEGPEGIAPGDMILIADRSRGNALSGGRVLSVAGTTFNMSNAANGSGTGTVYVEHQNGQIEWLTCTYNGASVTLTQSAVSPIAINDLYILVAQGTEAEPYIVLKVAEEEPNILGITAVKYDEDRINAIYNDVHIDTDNYMTLPPVAYVQPVAGPLEFVERFVTGTDVYQRVLDVVFRSPDELLSHYVATVSFNDGEWTPLPNVGAGIARISNVKAGTYEVRVMAVNRAGYYSAPVETSYVVGAVPADEVLEVGTISSIALQGQAVNVSEFSGRDAKFTWKINTPLSGYSLDAGLRDTAEVSGIADPMFQECVITMRRTGNSAVMRTESVVGTTYNYTSEKNAEDNAGVPVRSFIIGIQYRDRYGRLSAEYQKTVSNSAPSFPSTPTVTPVPAGLTVSAPKPTDLDYRGIKVYMSTVSPVALVAGNLRYDGPSNHITLTPLSSGAHYVVVVPVDDYGDGTVSSQIGPITPAVTASVVQMLLSNEDVSVPTANDGTGGDFSAAQGTIKVFSGTTDVTADAVLSIVGASVPIYGSLNEAAGSPVAGQPKGFYRVTGMETDAGFVRFQAVYGGVTNQREFTLSKAKGGAPGVGTPGASAKMVVVSSTHQTFSYDKAGVIRAQTTTFTATKQNTSQPIRWRQRKMDGTIMADRTAGEFVASSAVWASPSEGVLSLTQAGFNSFITDHDPNGMIMEAYVSDGQEFSDKISVIKIRDGETGDKGLNSATVVLYRRSASGVPALPEGVLTYTFSTGILVANAGSSLMSWTQTVPSGSDPLYRTQAVLSAVTDTIECNGPGRPALSAAALFVKDGAKGDTGPTGPTLTLRATQDFIRLVDGVLTPATQSYGVEALVNGALVTVNWELFGPDNASLSTSSSSQFFVTEMHLGARNSLRLQATYNGVVENFLFSRKDEVSTTKYEAINHMVADFSNDGALIGATADMVVSKSDKSKTIVPLTQRLKVSYAKIRAEGVARGLSVAALDTAFRALGLDPAHVGFFSGTAAGGAVNWITSPNTASATDAGLIAQYQQLAQNYEDAEAALIAASISKSSTTSTWSGTTDTTGRMPSDYASSGDNSVKNSRLITDASGWTLTGGFYRQVAVLSTDPGNYFRTNGSGSITSDLFPVPSGRKVYMSYWRRGSAPGLQAALNFAFFDESGVNTGGYPSYNNFAGLTDQWVFVKEEFTIPARAVRMFVSVGSGAPSGHNLDVALLRVSSTAEGADPTAENPRVFSSSPNATGGDNLIPNAEIWDGTDGWVGEGVRTANAAGAPIPFSWSNGNKKVGTYTGGDRQISIPAGTKKLFSEYWVYASAGGQQFTLYGIYADATGGFAGEFIHNYFSTGVGWQKAPIIAHNVPASAVSLQPSLNQPAGDATRIGGPRIGLTENGATVGAVSGAAGNFRFSDGTTATDSLLRNDQQTFAQIIDNADKPQAGAGKVLDTRNDNQPPSFYYAKGRGEWPEFKIRTVIGCPGNGDWAALKTFVQWTDASGGPIKQVAVTDFFEVYERLGNAGNNSWGAWRASYNEANKPRLGATGGVLDEGGNQLQNRHVRNLDLRLNGSGKGFYLTTDGDVAVDSFLFSDLGVDAGDIGETAGRKFAAESGADVTANAQITVLASDNISVNYDSTGQTPADQQLPRLSNAPAVYRGTTSVRTQDTTTYVAAFVGCTGTINNVNGSVDKGKFTITAVALQTGAYVDVTVTVGGKQMPSVRTLVVKQLAQGASASAPTSGSGTGPLQNTKSINGFNGTSHRHIVAPMLVRAGAGGKINLDVNTGFARSSQTNGSTNVFFKFQYRALGATTWNDIDNLGFTQSSVAAETYGIMEDPWTTYYEQYDGQIDVNKVLSGLVAGNDYEVSILAYASNNVGVYFRDIFYGTAA